MVEQTCRWSKTLSPHYRAHARARAGGRRLRHGVEQSGSTRGLSGSRPCLMHVLPCWLSRTCSPGTASCNPARCDVRRTARRGGDAARPQRRWQDYHPEIDHGYRRPARGLRALRGPRTDRPLVGQDRLAGIAFCPEERGIFSSLDVEENLLLPPVVRPGGLSLEGIFDLFPNLKERLRSSQGTKLSGGEQQMLAIGRILRTGARCFFSMSRRRASLRQSSSISARSSARLKEQGFTILLVEQNFRFASTVADRYYVMEHGVSSTSSPMPNWMRTSRSCTIISV